MAVFLFIFLSRWKLNWVRIGLWKGSMMKVSHWPSNRTCNRYKDVFGAWKWRQTLTDAAFLWRTGMRGASRSVSGSLLGWDEEDLWACWWTRWSFPWRRSCVWLHTPRGGAQHHHSHSSHLCFTHSSPACWTNLTFLVGIFSFMNSASRQSTFHGAWIFTKPTPGVLVWKHTTDFVANTFHDVAKQVEALLASATAESELHYWSIKRALAHPRRSTH